MIYFALNREVSGHTWHNSQIFIWNIGLQQYKLRWSHKGSNLGPLLFIMYVSDMTQFIQHVGIRLYADDTVFFLNAGNFEEGVTNMNLAAAQFWSWCNFNCLTIKLTKSKILLFSNLKLQSHLKVRNILNILINQVSLENIKIYKYLGLLLDEHYVLWSMLNI